MRFRRAFARLHNRSHVNEYVRDHPSKGTSAVHVIHYLATKMEDMNLDPDETGGGAGSFTQEPVTTHVAEARSYSTDELLEFKRLTSEAAKQAGAFEENG